MRRTTTEDAVLTGGGPRFLGASYSQTSFPAMPYKPKINVVTGLLALNEAEGVFPTVSEAGPLDIADCIHQATYDGSTCYKVFHHCIFA